MLKPFLINFKHWRNLMQSDETKRLYVHFWFFEVMNMLNPKMYKNLKYKNINR